MADERDKEVDVEEGGGVQPEGLVDEDEDLIAHPEWKWIAREPRRMASEITSTSLNVFTLVEGDPARWHLCLPSSTFANIRAWSLPVPSSSVFFNSSA
jgi:hypothetical protein